MNNSPSKVDNPRPGPVRIGHRWSAACGVLMAAVALTGAGCTHHHKKMHRWTLRDLRTPAFADTPGQEMFYPRAPHPEVVVTLPNNPGGKPRVYTVAGALFKNRKPVHMPGISRVPVLTVMTVHEGKLPRRPKHAQPTKKKRTQPVKSIRPTAQSPKATGAGNGGESPHQ